MDVREAILTGDMAAFKAALAPDVVWVGVLPGMLCRNREQVVEILDRAGVGRTFTPEIVAQREGRILLDPHADPPPDLHPTLHQVIVFEDGTVTEMRDFPDRGSALAALEDLG
jgi:ketosteroid isomerase-like protein